MDIDLKQYIGLFVEEAKEHLQSMNDALLNLEKDKDNLSHVNEIFRGSHTLKGMSGTMGFVNMSNLTHQMENVLDEVRNGRISLNEKIIDILFTCFDVLGDMVNYIAAYGQEKESDNSELIEELQKVIRENKPAEPDEQRVEEAVEFDNYVLNIIRKAKAEGLNGYKIQINLSPSCMLKSARAFIIFNLLESVGNIVYSNPSADDIEDEIIEKMMGDQAIFSRAVRGRYPTLMVYKMTEKNEFRYAKPHDYYYTTWEAINKGEGDQPEGSGGQTLSISTFVIMMLMNYKKRHFGNNNPWTVLILDNPFGSASGNHVLDPIFEIADKLNFQIIAFAAPEIIKAEISERFPVFWALNIGDEDSGKSGTVTGRVVHGGRVNKI